MVHYSSAVNIEISRKSWVIGIKSPASERIGLHSLGAADVVGLKDLIEHQQTKAERALGREVRVLCCYEAGYEGFWLVRWLDRSAGTDHTRTSFHERQYVHLVEQPTIFASGGDVGIPSIRHLCVHMRSPVLLSTLC